MGSMNYLSFEEEYIAKENLKKAFEDIKRKNSSLGFNRAELNFRGIPSISRAVDSYKSEIQDLINFIEHEQQKNDKYLQSIDLNDHSMINNTISAFHNQNKEQTKNREEEIKKSIESIDSYAARKKMILQKILRME